MLQAGLAVGQPNINKELIKDKKNSNLLIHLHIKLVLFWNGI